jgi:predicted ArsR family transcriptional regulator
MAQLTLPPFSNHSTSLDAAISVAEQAVGLRTRVLRVIFEHRGLTCDEVEQILGLKHQTVSARIRELYALERLVESGERRKTRSGRSAIVWRAK